MIRYARSYLVIFLVAGAAPVAGCVEPQDGSSQTSATLETRPADPEDSSAIEPEASALVEPVAPGCGQRFTLSLDASDADSAVSKNLPHAAAASCLPPDLYFHPDNGAHGGWIESWRLCNLGGGHYQICTGGSAPVRFFNPSSCGGTVRDFYPQGWHGFVQTGGGCC